MNARYLPKEYCEERHKILQNDECWKSAESALGKTYFEKHNREISFADLASSGNRFQISKRWLKCLNAMAKKNSESSLRIKVLAIDRERLDLTEFGEGSKGVDQTIYSRFFRTNLIGGKNMYWSQNAEIVQIWHDKGPQESRTLSVDEINSIGTEATLNYVNSNHKSKEIKDEGQFFASNMVQIADLMAGSLRCLHIGSNHISKEKKIIALETRKFVDSFNFHCQDTFPDEEYRLKKNLEGEIKSMSAEDNFKKSEVKELADPRDTTLRQFI